MVLMNTLSNRAQAWSGLVLSTLLVLTTVLSFLLYPSPSILTKTNPQSNLTITSITPTLAKSTWHLDRTLQEYLEINWDYSTDLTSKSYSLWNWNTKQIYLSLVVSWNGVKNEKNEAVLWDKIIRRKQDAQNINLIDQGNKYGVRELSKKWGNVPSATFTLKYNIMPKVGLLAYGDETKSKGAIPIPKRIITEQEKEKGRYASVHRLPY
ncbi:unnamed protein product [Sympodiomycopsis kandeliae]